MQKATQILRFIAAMFVATSSGLALYRNVRSAVKEIMEEQSGVNAMFAEAVKRARTDKAGK